MNIKKQEMSGKIYGIGLFRTGTSTIYENLKTSFRASHEFRMMPTLEIIETYIKGDISRSDFVKYVKRRDMDGKHQVDAAGFNFYFVDILLDLNPKAKFILTIRDCYSWVNSCMGYLFRHYHHDAKKQFIGRLVNNIDHLPDNRFKWSDRSEYKICVKQLIKMWAVVNTYMLRYIPSDQLLVLNTDNLSQCIGAIAEFVGTAENDLSIDHANKGEGNNFLTCFNSYELEKIFDRYCSTLMAEKFPDRTLSDFMRNNKIKAPLSTSEVRQIFSLGRFSKTKNSAKVNSL
jgi:hypothetical protein